MKKPSKSKKAPHLVLATEDAMIGALNRHAELSLHLAGEDAKHDELIATLNSGHTEATQGDRDELAQLENSIALFADTHRAELFPGEKKSKEYLNGTIGFRLSPPSVGTIVPKETQETIALRLDQLPWGEPYVTWKPVLNKDVLLRDRLTLTPEQLAVAGIRFKQEENFFITPAADAADRITKPATAAA